MVSQLQSRWVRIKIRLLDKILAKFGIIQAAIFLHGDKGEALHEHARENVYLEFLPNRYCKLSKAKTTTVTAFMLQATVLIQLVVTNRLIFDVSLPAWRLLWIGT